MSIHYNQIDYDDAQRPQVRSSKSPSRRSIVGYSSSRASQSSNRRGSSRHGSQPGDALPAFDPTLNDMDWGAFFNDFLQNNPDAGFDVPGFPDDDFLETSVQQGDSSGAITNLDLIAIPSTDPPASMSLLQNPGFALPSTPRQNSIQNSHQQQMGNQPAVTTDQLVWSNEYGTWLAPQLVNGQYYLRPVPVDPQITSVPKSPRNISHKDTRTASLGLSQLHLQDWEYGANYGQDGVHNNLFPGSHYPDPGTMEIHNHPYYAPDHIGYDYPGHLRSPSSPEVALNPRYVQDLENNGGISKVNMSSQLFDGLRIYTDTSQFPNGSRQHASSVHSARSPPFGGNSRRSSSRHQNRTSAVVKRDRNNKRQSSYQPESKQKYEKPIARPNVPGYRINATTQGLTTRTAKINGYESTDHYTYTEHPLGPWSSPYFEHTYTDEYSVVVQNQKAKSSKKMWIYEFADRTMSAAKIQDFILNYPRENKLTLWIQASPADSKLRYQSATGMKCRFAQCPTYAANMNGTIKHGAYRVAFDERYGTDVNYDPYLACCGFVHLYCMERFLDFEYICRKARVKVDVRSLPNEPKSRYYASLHAKDEAIIAQDFIHQAQFSRTSGDNLGVRNGVLNEFQNYPVHEHYRNGAEKPYESTLCYEMFKRHERDRPPAQKKQFSEGANGLSASKVYVHRGDLEIIAKDHLRQKRRKIANKKAGKDIMSPDPYDSASSFCEKVRFQIARAKRDLAKSMQHARPRKQQSRVDDGHADRRRNVHRSFHGNMSDFDDDEDGSELETYDAKKWEKRYRESGGSPNATRRSKRIEGASHQPIYNEEQLDGNFGQYHGYQRQNSHHQPIRSPRQSSYVKYQQQPNFADDLADLGLDFSTATPRARSSHGGPPVPGSAVSHKRSREVYEQQMNQPQDAQVYVNAQNFGGLFYNDSYNATSGPHPSKRQRSIASQGSKRARHPPTPGGQSSGGLSFLFENDHGMTQPEDLAELFGHYDDGALNRRMSMVDSPRSYKSIMRQSGSQTPVVNKRHASFNTQPVSRQKTFNSNAPPHNVKSRMLKELDIDAAQAAQAAHLRRSKRRSPSSPGSSRTLRSGRSLGTIPE